MGVLENLGVPAGLLGSINWAGIGYWISVVFVFVVVAIIVGVGVFFYYARKANKQSFNNKVPIFTSINGKHSRIGIDEAKEVFIPESNISLFYLKGRKIYIARPTRAMGKNEYWYSISENGEWVNFDLSSEPEKDTLAVANYDHRDTRYAYVNLKDIIKRNYKDKSVQWWKEYSHLITFIIVSIIFVGSCWILLAKIGKLVTEMQPLIAQWTEISKIMSQAVQNAQNINSGVIQG